MEYVYIILFIIGWILYRMIGDGFSIGGWDKCSDITLNEIDEYIKICNIKTNTARNT